jgi:competence protein ComEC
MPLPTAYFWNKAPVVRLLIALIAGIVVQWQVQFSLSFLVTCLCVSVLFSLFYFLIPLKSKFSFGYINGIASYFLIAFVGAMLVWLHDIRNNKAWIGHEYKEGNFVFVTIAEPLVEKTNSYKALARVNSVHNGKSLTNAEGELILYFKKDSLLRQLHYGSQIVFNKSLQEIKNAGNPGSFDYKRYSLFQGITHQVYLLPDDFEILHFESRSAFRSFIFSCRKWVVSTLQRFIPGEKEQGFAEALLIGYKDDLDQRLVQSYTNTGVVHIIAISGMHLALIYGLLVFLTKPVRRRKELRWLRLVLILSGLWLFTLLAGAQASVVRSAVMFTCIVLGEAFERRTSIYNTLALSAFILLCFNPFWLWDVGFQLSYAAVVSIVTFYRPVYNWFYFPNKTIDFFWKTMAVSIAAQILTTPVSLYHFHQFPVLFLLTNVVAVPLSGLVLLGELLVCAVSWWPLVAKAVGWLLHQFIFFMNSYIERIESISFSLWNGFSINIFQTILLLITATTICFWLMEKRKMMLWTALCSLLLFFALRSWSFSGAYNQRKLIVYNVPKFSAIDLIAGRRFTFLGDPALLHDDFTRNFHIQPSRVLHRIEQDQGIPVTCKDVQFCKKRVVLIDNTEYFLPLEPKQTIDVLILSKNPRLYISGLLKSFFIRQIVIDGSVPAWKARLWKHDCDSLKIPCYDVSEKGAFVMNL